MTHTPPKPPASLESRRDELAAARVKELTAYMSDKERDKLIAEGRSETYATYRMAFDAALAECAPRIAALEAEVEQGRQNLANLELWRIKAKEVAGERDQARAEAAKYREALEAVMEITVRGVINVEQGRPNGLDATMIDNIVRAALSGQARGEGFE